MAIDYGISNPARRRTPPPPPTTTTTTKPPESSNQSNQPNPSLQQNVESLHGKFNEVLSGDTSSLVQDFKDIPGDVGGFFSKVLGGAGDVAGDVGGALYRHFFPLLNQGKKKGGGAGGASAQGQGQTQPQTQPQPQTPADPNALALQMFFTSTIAPYLNALSQNMTNAGSAYSQALQQVQPRLNPAIQPYFNPATRQAQVNQYANALASSAVAAPQLDQLMSAINEAANMQRFMAYQQMQNRANSQSGGLLAGLLGAAQGEGGGGDADALVKLLGGGQ